MSFSSLKQLKDNFMARFSKKETDRDKMLRTIGMGGAGGNKSGSSISSQQLAGRNIRTNSTDVSRRRNDDSDLMDFTNPVNFVNPASPVSMIVNSASDDTPTRSSHSSSSHSWSSCDSAGSSYSSDSSSSSSCDSGGSCGCD